MLPMSRPAPQAPRRPDLAFTFSHPAHALALGMGSGLAPKAPGTAGTLFAWASWLLLASWLPAQALWWLLLFRQPPGSCLQRPGYYPMRQQPLWYPQVEQPHCPRLYSAPHQH